MAIKTAEPEIEVNSSLVRLMTFRYSGFEATTMEGFISLMLRLGKTTSTFKDNSTDGVINFSWEEWTEFSMYN
ncbi:hypothetical protein KUCAC02_003506 [Chaenocephalus aceratus]|uniref:Uncharacterized protein n=1 Tax=Chaenocephalus aceratus TaxID=36190 RepID=A0ACB9WLP1_CHAAC|nr:hypothetical protein KUCAC02_003506 [Chaenocephalus aceratus]